MIQEALQQYGLTDKEAALYLALLELGSSSILQLSSKTKINRTTLYHTIDNLIEKRFVTQSKKGKQTVYVAEHPSTLKQLFKEKLKQFDTLLPELVTRMNHDAIKPVLKYYEGIEGVKEVYRASLNAKENELKAFVGIESLQVRDKALIHFWQKEYIPARKKNNKLAKLVIPDDELAVDFHSRDKQEFRESRLLPASTYNFECEIMCYDNVVSMISYHTHEVFAVTIESQLIANTMKMIWKLAWNSARK